MKEHNSLAHTQSEQSITHSTSTIKLSSQQRAFILAAATIILTFSFYSMNSGITCTNDGSHFALFNSLVERHSPELRENIRFALYDSASYKSKYYSDRNPGLGLFAYAFYDCFAFLSPIMKNIYMDPCCSNKFMEKEKPRVTLIMVIPALLGALTFLGLFFLLNSFDEDFFINFFTALSFVLGTILLRYSTLLYSHILSCALIIFSFLLFFKYVKEGGLSKLSLASFCLAYAVLVEHVAFVLYFPLSCYLLVKLKKKLFHWKTLSCIIIATIIPAAILLAYNYTCFENPLSIAHFYHSVDYQNHSFKTLFVFKQSLIQIYRLFFGAPVEIVHKQNLMGLLPSSPFLIFIFLCIPFFIKKQIKISLEHWTAFTGFVCVMFFASSIFDPYGGWDRDYRYFCIVVPLLAPLLTIVLKRMLQASLSKQFKIVLLTVFCISVLYSISTQLIHIRHIFQEKYPSHFINFGAAIVNIGLFVVLFTFLTWPAYLLLRKLNLCRPNPMCFAKVSTKQQEGVREKDVRESNEKSSNLDNILKH